MPRRLALRPAKVPFTPYTRRGKGEKGSRRKSGAVPATVIGLEPRSQEPAFAVVRTRPGPADRAWRRGRLGRPRFLRDDMSCRCKGGYSMHSILFTAPPRPPRPPPEPPADAETIVVTAIARAGRMPSPTLGGRQPDSPSSPTCSGCRWSPTVLRLIPGVSVAISGPRGSQTQVRHPRGRSEPHPAVRRRNPLQRSRRRQRGPLRAARQRSRRPDRPDARARNRPCGDRRRSAEWSPSTRPTPRRRPRRRRARGEYGSLDSARASASVAASAGQARLRRHRAAG